MRVCAFHFLFENFKKFYLPYIFPDWKPEKPLYGPSQGETIFLLNNRNSMIHCSYLRVYTWIDIYCFFLYYQYWRENISQTVGVFIHQTKHQTIPANCLQNQTKLVCFILFTVKLRPVSNKHHVSNKCPGGHMLFSGSAPSPISTPLPRRIPISAPQNLLYKLLSLRHLWKEAPNTLSLQLFLDQQ